MDSGKDFIISRTLGFENETSMDNSVVMNYNDVTSLISFIRNPPVTDSIFYGDITKWLHSCKWYPFKILTGSNLGIETNDDFYMSVDGKINNACMCRGYAIDGGGFFLGQYKFDQGDSFIMYQPITKIKVWLPYYGYVSLNYADVKDSYVQFRLYVDYTNGQAQYVIGVTNEELKVPKSPYLLKRPLYDGVDDSNTRILGNYSFQLGVDIPISSTGAADKIRNIALTALKGAVQVGGALAGVALGLPVSKSESTVVEKGRPEGRLVTTKKETATQTTDYSGFTKQRALSTAVETAGRALEAIHYTPTSEKANNGFLDYYLSHSIIIIFETAKYKYYTGDFDKLYGRPLCEPYILGKLKGYTEISEIHSEGTAFAQATETEIAMLEQELTQGIILP